MDQKVVKEVPKFNAPNFTPSQFVKEATSANLPPTATPSAAQQDESTNPEEIAKQSRKKAEKKLHDMITCTGPDLFVQGTLADNKLDTSVKGNRQNSLGANNEFVGHEDDTIPGVTTSLVNAACKESAPFDLILQFMTSVMSREYEEALRVGQEILKIETDNKLVADFIPVLEEIVTYSDSEDETSEYTSSDSAEDEEDSGSDSGSESDSNSSERSPSSSAESDEEASAASHLETSSESGDSSCGSEDDDEENVADVDELDGAGSLGSDDGYDSEEIKNMNKLVNNVLKF